MLSADDWACVAGTLAGTLVGATVIAFGVIGITMGALVSGLVFVVLGLVCWGLTIRAMLDAAGLL